MSTHSIHPSALLRFALRADGVVSLAAGLLTCALLQPLQPIIGASTTHILAIGVFMAVYGIAVGLLGGSTRMDRRLVSGIVIGNSGWVLASVAVLLSDWIDPSALGIALILGQAAVVALLTVLQFVGLRRSAAAASQAPALQVC